MKKLTLVITSMVIALFSFSQADSLQQYKLKEGVYDKGVDTSFVNKTCVTMLNGKLMVLKQGTLVPMEDAMILQNGTIIMMNGMIKTKEGKVTQINEGDCLNMFGEMIPLYDTKMGNEQPPKNNKQKQ